MTTLLFAPPCHLVTKAKLRDLGHFHFIDKAPIVPSRHLKIERKTKVDISGDFDTKVQACSTPMLTAIAEDTKAVVSLLGPEQQFLFFGSTTAQCDAQREAYKAAGLNVESYHNRVSSWEQKDIMARFRSGEIQGLCTVAKVNRGFDLPSISLVVIGFGTASRSKYEQMCGRAQRMFEGKTAAWVLDYGGHGVRFGSANWDWPEAIEFYRREKLRVPAEELAEAIRAGRRDPKCEVRPDNFMDLFEETVDLFYVILKPARNGRSVHIHYVNSLGDSVQTLHPGNGWTARVLRMLGTPRFQQWAEPPATYDELVADIMAADLPSHIMLRRVFDSYCNKIAIAVVGYVRDGNEDVFDDKPVVTQEWLAQRAHDRLAGYGEEPRAGPGAGALDAPETGRGGRGGDEARP
jgi:Helicase conserved C-terminal domain